MKTLKGMMITLIMCLVGMTSYSQEKDPTALENEKEIRNISLALRQSTNHLIKSSNQARVAVVVGVVTSVLSSLIILDGYKNTPPYAQAAVLTIGGGVTLGFGISSIVNRRRGYRALSGLKL